MLHYPFLATWYSKREGKREEEHLHLLCSSFFPVCMHACLLVVMKPVGVVVAAAAAAAERKQTNLLEAKNTEKKWDTNQLT